MTIATRTAAAALSLFVLSCSKSRAPAKPLAPPASGALTSDCTGVVPDAAALTAHYSIVQTHGSATGCLTQDGDGNGAIATALYNFPFDVFNWTSRDEASGEVYGTLGAPQFLLAQNDGFLGLTGTHHNEPLDLHAWNEDGTGRGVVNLAPHIDQLVYRAAVDPTGGALVVLSKKTGGTWNVSGQLFDDAANDNSGKQVVATGAGAAPQFVGAGVDLLGNALIAWDGHPQGFAAGTLLGVWMDQGGNLLTDVFVVATGIDPAYEPRFLPLAENEGLALENKGIWRAQIADLSTTPAPAPAFLLARPNTSFALIRSGNAYAVWSEANFDLGTCEQRVETYASAGNLCGHVSLRSAPGPCGQDRLKVTRDGTGIDLFQNAANQCTWKVYPLLFN